MADVNSGPPGFDMEETEGLQMMDAKEQAAAFLKMAEKNVDLSFSPVFVLPGDDVTEKVTRVSKKIRLGPGLFQENDRKVMATAAGMLRYRPPHRYWVEFSRKRYIPTVGDAVVGVIEDKNADFYKVNLAGSAPAIMPVLSFDGATKRNRPNLQIGALVYARVVVANKNMDPELSCMAAQGAVKKDWMTGESTYGPLYGGMVFRTNSRLCRRLMNPECAVLQLLGQKVPYEVAVGANGIFWVNSGELKQTILIGNAILNSEGLTDAQTEVMVNQLLSLLES